MFYFCLLKLGVSATFMLLAVKKRTKDYFVNVSIIQRAQTVENARRIIRADRGALVLICLYLRALLISVSSFG